MKTGRRNGKLHLGRMFLESTRVHLVFVVLMELFVVLMFSSSPPLSSHSGESSRCADTVCSSEAGSA